jgi:hypothetical protein
MKKNLLILTALVTITVSSCKNETKNQETEILAPEQADIMESDMNSPEIACYRYISKKDTILLQMEKMNDEVAGTLSYNYFEKDKNDGTFEGKMIGDTLFANYTFNSEDAVSVREVVFVKKGKQLVEAFGDVEEVDGKIQFKNNTKYTLNDVMLLEEINCDEN